MFIGLKHVGYKARKVFSAKNSANKHSEQYLQKHEEKIGELGFTVLSQLRGTAI